MKRMIETSPAVHNNAALSRFELDTGDGLAIANYRAEPGLLIVDHTEVPSRLRERGIGSELAHAVLERVRAEGLKVVPRCCFMRHYIDKHPQFQDLVAPR